uniref:Biotin transporter n=1 Tax=Paulinella chromatophora TaxID=39717 RepID=B1X433_PAUCH|nr:hypothetical protein PCC_0253 [Paulinella chromatophora]ACB42702.1 hypothetical protein PCC_0253 [Paulinella chromatophora]
MTGVFLITVGNLIQAGIALPCFHGGINIIPLASNLQVAALLLTALVFGPRSGFLAALIYMSLGLLQVPLFGVGGNISYFLTPSFGYLAGFMPAAWLAGQFSRQQRMEDPLKLSMSAILGLGVIQLSGILNILLGHWSMRWSDPLSQLIIKYSISPCLVQLALCCGIGLLALPLRKLLLLN